MVSDHHGHHSLDLRSSSHDHSGVFNLRPDEVHTDHSGQVVHAHLVDGTVQLDFMQKSADVAQEVVVVTGENGKLLLQLLLSLEENFDTGKGAYCL